MKKTLRISSGDSDIIIDLKDVRCIRRIEECVWIHFYDKDHGCVSIISIGNDWLKVSEYIHKTLSDYFREEPQHGSRYITHQSLVSNDSAPFEALYLQSKE